ncbi:MAG: cardiolipin synthase ClsB [Burkholderiaceae bacterium]|nr:cardiolipin synthase ClsB [Burkholderiaceae bacterium]
MESPLILLQGGKEYFPAVIAAIRDARTTIYIESYLIHDDPAIREVLGALIDASGRGVEVFLLLDGFGAAQDADWVRSLLTPHNIQVELYRPGLRWLAPHTWRRLHRKLVMIDERVGFVGGINLIGDCVDPTRGNLPGPRLDFAVQVTSYRPISAISRAMRRLWWRVSLRNAFRGSLGRLLAHDRRQAELVVLREAWRRTRRHLRWRGPPARRHASRRARLLLRDNFRNRRDIERWYLSRIEFAAREILIANAYFVPTFRFRQALIRAATRGVRVRLLIQSSNDQWWTHWATQALIGELVAAGVMVFEYTESFLHAKVAVIDDAVTVGSSNIDPFSLMFSLEANLVAVDPAIAENLRARLESAISNASRRLQPAAQYRGPVRALARRISLTFALMALRIFIAFSGQAFRIR